MGAEFSSIQAPLSINIELTVGEEELAKVRELWRNITINSREQAAGARADRQEHATRQAGAHYAGGAGNATTTGGAGVTRAGGAVSTAGGAITRAGGFGGQRRDIGGVEALQGCSTDSTGSVKTRNVTFIKAGRCHRLGCNKGHTGRRYDRMNGLITPSSAKASEKRKAIETITITGSDIESSDEESLEQMEKRLAKMLELKFRRSKDSRK